MSDKDYGYDLETYINVFTALFKHIETGERWIFEISDWADHSAMLYNFLRAMEYHELRAIGFNNLSFDYPLIHHFMSLYERGERVTARTMYDKAQEIIGMQNGNRFGAIVWNPRIPQIDLLKVHHFDNPAKSTGLKVLEFNMRSGLLFDTPFSPHVPLTFEQRNTVIAYNAHDVDETIKFAGYTREKIAFREKLEPRFKKSLLNHNDTKIGKDYLIMKLEEFSPGICYTREKGQRQQPRQTYRRSIKLGEVIFPYIQFRTPDLCRVLDYLKSTEVFETKKAPELSGISARIRDFQVDFGLGGLHGSLESTAVRATEDTEIVDVDVTSFYPKLAIVNRVYPEHLSERFCDIYEELFNERSNYAKKTPENEMLKLSLNGVYGDSNNDHSPFRDPKYTMTITVNGQLSLCMLAENLTTHDGIRLIQANTDGITCQVHKSARPHFDAICEWWQKFTLLGLEYANYKSMFIRDVNNYLAVSTDGKIKRIGEYMWETQAENPGTRELWWNKDWSHRVVAKAAQAVMVDGADLRQFIHGHEDAWDFMLRVKVPSTSRLMAVSDDKQEQLQNVTRYYMAHHGPHLIKVMPPLAKNAKSEEYLITQPDGSVVTATRMTPGPERPIAVQKGYQVGICNDVRDFSWANLNHEWYVQKAEALIIR